MTAKNVNPALLTTNREVWDLLVEKFKIGRLGNKLKSKKSLENYYWTLRGLDDNGIDARKFTEQDAEKIVGFWNDKLASSTAKVRCAALKKLIKFLEWGNLEKKGYPASVEWVPTTMDKSKRKGIEIISKKDIKAMIRVTKNQRDRALIFTLYESGMRASEFLSLRIGDVEIDNPGAILSLKGRLGVSLKTGPRRVRVFEATPDLQLWINQHPERDNPDAVLWCTWGPNSSGEMVVNSLDGLIERYRKAAGIKKAVHPHMFRHSRASHLAKHLTEAQMCEFFGWVQGSNMPSVYVHLSGRDVDDALMEAHGIEVDKKKNDDRTLAPRKCFRGHENTFDARFCNDCGVPLDEKTLIELEEKRKVADTMMDVLFEDGEVKGFLAKKLRELELSQ